ncbi:type IV conjugative transfer system lipoprotein TraV [Pectobacterium aroidearum]|uniref:type IV conjugative transfer system lipoprotein TraV n=1 Tax=Pectobacterium aroidearum TaxID=1201031 RepID=UPI003017CBE0
MKLFTLALCAGSALVLSGCAGTASDFECNATTSDTCMTMEQANEKAKTREESSQVKPVAMSLPRLADGHFRTTPQPGIPLPPAHPPVASTAGIPQPPAHPAGASTTGVSGTSRPFLQTAAPVSVVTPLSAASRAVPPRPLRLGEETAALWIAPYIDSLDIYHQPSNVFFVVKPAGWGKPRVQ